MIDFKRLIDNKTEKSTYDLDAIYSSLDVKSSHTELRTAQKEAITELTRRAEERDLVLKVSTGAGKTAVGLLYLYGHMKVTKKPVAYLCPTIQLVNQVLQEAGKLGISASHYPGGETYPDPACLRGDSILICTYEKLFNAKTTFVRTDVNLMPHAIVMDDAHAGVEIIRNQFTLKLTGGAYDFLLSTLESRCKAYDRTKWLDVRDEDPQAAFEVPHWIWTEFATSISEGLHAFAKSDEFKFVWPYLTRILNSCRCIVSGTHSEITPEVLPFYFVEPFDSCPHRLFMSATLADDSLLTRELGVDPVATKSPIAPKSDRGLGERMVLAPSLIDPALDRQFVMQLCSDLATKWNVVVLTSSGAAAEEWECVGATYFAAESFQQGIDQLRDPYSDVRFAVFAQRYDGIDLPDESCRVLVMDGIPRGENLVDREDSRLSLIPGGVRNKTIFRIEQGMGRAVRSHADYAVVLLVGLDLATFVGRQDVLSSMSIDVRNQLGVAIKLSELARQSSPPDHQTTIRQLINQCLGRDEGWKDFYTQQVRQASVESEEIDSARIDLAFEETEAHRLVAMNSAAKANSKFSHAIESTNLSPLEKGVYLQRLARIAGLVDPTEALQIQAAARNLNMSVANPPEAVKKPPAPGAKSVGQKFCRWYKEFEIPNAAVLSAQRVADRLDLSAKPEQVEAAMQDIGKALGADSHRPEKDYGNGPDNLWFWGPFCFVFEAKNQNRHTLHKRDAEQLHGSLDWTKRTYPQFAEQALPIVVARVTETDSDATYPQGTRVLDGSGCEKLGLALKQLCEKLAREGPVFVTPESVSIQLSAFKLLPEQFLKTYTVQLN